MSCVDSEILIRAYQQVALKQKRPNLSEFEVQPRIQDHIGRYPQAPDTLLKRALNASFSQFPKSREIEGRIISAIVNEEPLRVIELKYNSPQVEEVGGLVVATREQIGLAALELHCFGYEGDRGVDYTFPKISLPELARALGFNKVGDPTLKRWMWGSVAKMAHNGLHHILDRIPIVVPPSTSENQ